MIKITTKSIIALGLASVSLVQAEVTATAVSAPVAAPAQQAAASINPAEVKEVVSYIMGYQFGQQLATEASTMKVSDLDNSVFFAALQDGMNNQFSNEMQSKNIEACMRQYLAELDARGSKVSATNIAAGKKYLTENAAKDGVVTTKSGLQYKIIKAGTGRSYNAAKDGKSAIANVEYRGSLVDGKVFDSSRAPINMPVDQVVPGFSEALKLMPIGSEWEVSIPSNLAYGAKGPGVIGNNATLIFNLKLHDIKPGQGTAANPMELTPEMIEQLQKQAIQSIQTQGAQPDVKSNYRASGK